MSDAVSVRTFGDVEVAVIHCGYIHWVPGFKEGQDWRADADVADDGRSILGINYALVRTPEATIMIDPNSFSPTDTLGAVASLIAGPSIESVMEELHVDADEVTHVLITHGHADHFTALIEHGDETKPRFKAAQHFFPAKDFPADDATGYGVADVLKHLKPVQNAGLLQLVEGDVEVCEGVTLLATPGESEGHQVIRLDTPDARFYYLGDLVHYPVEVDHIDWVAVGSRDLEALVPSRRRVFSDAAVKPSTHVFTHAHFPAWGTIGAAGQGAWSWHYA